MYSKISGNIIEKMADAELSSIGYFQMADGYVLGGDCEQHYDSPYINKNDASLIGCAEKCLKNENCQRFSFSKFNMEGGDGLGCRISNNGKCSVTVDKFRKEKEEGKKLDFDDKMYGLNYYNGQLYDRLTKDELDKVKSNSKSNIIMKSSSSSKSIINNNVVQSEKNSQILEIVDGKVVKKEIDGINMLNKGVEEGEKDGVEEGKKDSSHIYIIGGIILLLILIISIYFTVINKNTK